MFGLVIHLVQSLAHHNLICRLFASESIIVPIFCVKCILLSVDSLIIWAYQLRWGINLRRLLFTIKLKVVVTCAWLLLDATVKWIIQFNNFITLLLVVLLNHRLFFSLILILIKVFFFLVPEKLIVWNLTKFFAKLRQIH